MLDRHGYGSEYSKQLFTTLIQMILPVLYLSVICSRTIFNAKSGF